MTFSMNKLKVRGKCYRLCPYSVEAEADTRIPEIEKTSHPNTDGKMIIVHGGFFTCFDDACSYYTGTATTPIPYAKWNPCTQTVVSGTITPTAGARFREG